MNNMKTNAPKLRSIFTSGINLGDQVHRTKTGKGSYRRKNRYNKW
jgi:stalled ribosome alternative rescue factor ArfA